MNNVGFGVMVNNIPKGLWPTSLTHAQEVQARYLKNALPGQIVSIVPVYVGQPIDQAVDHSPKRFA